jgi:hypothetical protein
MSLVRKDRVVMIEESKVMGPKGMRIHTDNDAERSRDSKMNEFKESRRHSSVHLMSHSIHDKS